MTDIVEQTNAVLEDVSDDPMLIHLTDARAIVSLMSELLAEVEQLRERLLDDEYELKLARDGISVRPMTEAESNLMTQVLDLRRERTELRAEVERLRREGPRCDAGCTIDGGGCVRRIGGVE